MLHAIQRHYWRLGLQQSEPKWLPEERELRIDAFARSLSCLVQYRSRTDAIYRHRHTTCYNHGAVKCAGKHPTEDDLELYSLTRIPAGPVLDAIEEHLS